MSDNHFTFSLIQK